MSLDAIIQSLTDRIEAVTPSWDGDHGFHTHEGNGVAVDFAAIPDTVIRAFDLRLAGGPVDDGASGWVTDRFRVPLELLVRYPAADRHRSEMMIASDVVRLTHALIHPNYPTPWHDAIESIVPPGPPRITTLTGPESQVKALLLTLPFTLIYTDAGEAG